jgi:hypothetical protein
MGLLMIQKLGSREAMTHAMIIVQTTVSGYGSHNSGKFLTRAGAIWLSIQETIFLLLCQGI